MKTSPGSEKPVIILIGNYPLDFQESMLRFRNLLQTELNARGTCTISIFPRGYFGRMVKKGAVAKWLGYLDKYVLFPPVLAVELSGIKRRFKNRKIVVHICDHSNSVYTALARRWFPVLVTCHDLLAVRGARGEDTDCPASGFGRLLQSAILDGLGKATSVACVSRATEGDLIRLLGPSVETRSQVVPLALNYFYRVLTPEETLAGLARAGINHGYHQFVLHVGSGLRRKNREALLLSAAFIKDSWTGQIVFAGDPLSAEERAQVRSLGLEKRVCEIPRPDNETLVALYNGAHCLIFMSRFEGFGWPILEAQASGCPVICSDRTSLPEVAGDGALIDGPEDYAAIAADIRRLQEPAFRDSLIARGFANVRHYSTGRMMDAYAEIYARI